MRRSVIGNTRASGRRLAAHLSQGRRELGRQQHVARLVALADDGELRLARLARQHLAPGQAGELRDAVGARAKRSASAPAITGLAGGMISRSVPIVMARCSDTARSYSREVGTARFEGTSSTSNPSSLIPVRGDDHPRTGAAGCSRGGSLATVEDLEPSPLSGLGRPNVRGLLRPHAIQNFRMTITTIPAGRSGFNHIVAFECPRRSSLCISWRSHHQDRQLAQAIRKLLKAEARRNGRLGSGRCLSCAGGDSRAATARGASSPSGSAAASRSKVEVDGKVIRARILTILNAIIAQDQAKRHTKAMKRHE